MVASTQQSENDTGAERQHPRDCEEKHNHAYRGTDESGGASIKIDEAAVFEASPVGSSGTGRQSFSRRLLIHQAILLQHCGDAMEQCLGTFDLADETVREGCVDGNFIYAGNYDDWYLPGG